MDDLIKRLQDGLVTMPAVTDGHLQADMQATVSLMSEAAAALTEAQAEIERLREALGEAILYLTYPAQKVVGYE